MTMGTDAGAVDHVHAPVEPARRVALALQLGQDALPEAAFGPAIESRGHRPPRPVPLRQVTPGSAGLAQPEQGVDDRPVIPGRPADPRPLRRQKRRQTPPCRLRQLVSAHAPRQYTKLTRFENRP